MKLKKKEGSFQVFVSASFIILVIAISVLNIKVKEVKAIQRNVEDGLVASNLACATIDLKEYGTSNKVTKSDFTNTYTSFKKHLKSNLKLDNSFNPTTGSFIKSKVDVLDFRIYNVVENNVIMNRISLDGTVNTEYFANGLGNIKTPEGVVVESVTIYSKIGFEINGYLSIDKIPVTKESSVDVIKN